MRGRDIAGVIEQYTKFVKPAFDMFVAPSRKHADVIIPWGRRAAGRPRPAAACGAPSVLPRAAALPHGAAPLRMPLHSFLGVKRQERACDELRRASVLGALGAAPHSHQRRALCHVARLRALQHFYSKALSDPGGRRGGRQENVVAIDLITEHIRMKLQQPELRRIYVNLEVIPSNYQIRGMHTIIRDRSTSKADFVFYADRLLRLARPTPAPAGGPAQNSAASGLRCSWAALARRPAAPGALLSGMLLYAPRGSRWGPAWTRSDARGSGCWVCLGRLQLRDSGFTERTEAGGCSRSSRRGPGAGGGR